jgi:hypothetical protein
MKPYQFILRVVIIIVLFLIPACTTTEVEKSSEENGQGQPQINEKKCGDGICDGPENTSNCPDDCGEKEVAPSENEKLPEDQPETPPEGTRSDACDDPNPHHAIVSQELLEWRNWLKDGGFEAGETEVVVNSLENLSLGNAERSQDAARNGSWGYVLTTGAGEGISFAIKAYMEKGEDIRFSFWARSLNGEVTFQPVVYWVELNKEQGSHNSMVPEGDFTIGEDWTQVTFDGFNDKGLRYALLTLEIGPNSQIHIDDFQVEHPIWKMAEYSSGSRIVGGIPVPVEPVAPVNIAILIHMEDPVALQEVESYFFKESAKFEEMARTLHNHNGQLTIQAEEDWFLGLEKFDPDLATRFVRDYNVVYSTHTHGPHCMDENGRLRSLTDCNNSKADPNWDQSPNATDYPWVIDYVRAQKEMEEAAAEVPITDHNGNWEFTQSNRFAEIPMLTWSAFKSHYDQRTFDILINNPFRPSEVDPHPDPKGFLTHDPNNSMIYIPGWGQAITRHEERLQDRMSTMISQFIKYASPDRVNTFYIVTHVGILGARDEQNKGKYLMYEPDTGDVTLGEEFISDLDYWDMMLTELIDPLVAAGYLQWASLPEMGEMFIQWEQECILNAGTEKPSVEQPGDKIKSEERCGDGVCDGPEDGTTCPEDCGTSEAGTQPVTTKGEPDYEPPINVMMILHIDPNMDKEAGIFEVTPEVYQRTRDEIIWLADESARHDLHFTSLYNGWYTKEALELGELQQFTHLLEAGHELGTHAHSLTYDSVQDLWRERIDEVRRYGRPVYNADLATQSWYEADYYMDAVMDAIGTAGSNQTMCAVPFLCSDEGLMMAEYGFSYAAGNRSERGLGLFGHIIWNPWRPASSDEPGHEIEEDLNANFIAVDHHAQIGTATEAHGMVDTDTEALKRHFLMLYVEWLNRERTGAEDRVWTFGFIYHPNYGNRYNDDVIEFLDWLDRYFVGQTSPHGHQIARYATVAEVGHEYLEWESNHPGTSSFSYVAGDPYPYTYAFIPSKLEDAVYETVIDLGPGVNCFKLSKDGKPIYLLWSDAGEVTVDFSGELSGQVQVTNSVGDQFSQDASAIIMTEEPVFIEP